MSGKDLSSYLKQPAGDEVDLGVLGDIDFDALDERVAVMQAGGGEVIEASNECEGGGCKI